MRILCACFALVLFLQTLALAGPGGKLPYWKRLNLPDKPESVLQEILQTAEFQQTTEKSILEQIWDAFDLLLARLLRWIFSLFPEIDAEKLDPGILSHILTIMLWALGLSALVAATYYLFLFLRSRKYASVSRPYSQSREMDRISPSLETWQEALKKAEQGLYPEALILLFRYAIVFLHEKGLLSLHPGKTSTEILRTLRTDAQVREPLSEMTRLFNQVRYGDALCSKSDYEHFLALCHETRDKVRS